MAATTPTFEPRSGPTWRDPFSMYAVLRDEVPVLHVEDGDYWVLSRFVDVWDAARDTSTFSSAEGLTITYGERERIGLDEAAPIVMTDPPAHSAFRRLVAGGFTPRQVAQVEPEVRSFVRERLGRLEDAGGGDVVAGLFKPLPSMVVAHYLGVPAADRDRFDVWTEAIVEANAGGDVGRAAERLVELFGYFEDLVARRRAEQQAGGAAADDVVSQLVACQLAGTDVAPMAVLGFAFTMVAGGNDTTTGLLGVAAQLLTEHPDQRQRLIDDPSAIPVAVEEALRLASPVQGLARTTTRPVHLHDVTIPAGRKVLLLYASANRDPREFGPEAEQCDLGRPIRRMMSFGYGAHHCLGAAAARLQARVALEELLARFPHFSVDVDAATFAEGNYVRRYASLPMRTTGT
jgi:cytochrome P450 family 130